MKTTNLLYLLTRLAVAIILLQTLFFKFTGATESVYIFSSINAEPVGRIGSGVIELIASILLFVPGLNWLGAILALGSMSGAIATHLFIIGIDVLGDGGTLFYLALIVFVCATYIAWQQRKSIPILKNYVA